MDICCNNNFGSFNRLKNLEGIEWTCVDYLLNSTSKYANNLWKLLRYPETDCLIRKDLTREEKLNLIYTDTGQSNDKRLFIQPLTDDSCVSESSRMNIYVGDIDPINQIQSKVQIVIEVMCHNKITNILGEAFEDDPRTNPSELDGLGNSIILYKNRATTLLRNTIAEFNGADIAGIGLMQLNQEISNYSRSRFYVFNTKAYIGHRIVFYCYFSGASSCASSGY